MKFFKKYKKNHFISMLGGKKSFLKFMKDFVRTPNFQAYLKNNFNLLTIKSMETQSDHLPTK